MYEIFNAEMAANTIAMMCAVPVVLFTVLYGFLVRWYNSLLGVSLFSLFLSFSFLFSMIIARRLIGEFSWYQELAFGVYSFMFLSFTFFFAIFLIERRRGKETLPVPIGRAITNSIKIPQERQNK